VYSISNDDSGLYLSGNNIRVHYSDLNYNGTSNIELYDVNGGYIESNIIYTNDENAIFIRNSSNLEIGGNSAYGDYNSTGFFIKDSNNIYSISNNFYNFYQGIDVLNDRNSNIFANLIRDSNYGARIQNSLYTDLNLLDVANIVETAVSLIDSNFLRIVDNIINVYSNNNSATGLSLMNSNNNDINSNMVANSNFNITLANSSNNEIKNNTLFDANVDWLNLNSSNDNNLENTYFIMLSNGRLKQKDLLSLPSNLDLNTNDLNILDNNAIINLGDFDLFDDSNFLVEFTNMGVLRDTNILRKGSLCSDCTDLNSDSEGVYYFEVMLDNDNNIEYFSINGVDTNDTSSVNITSPSNNSNKSSSSVTINYELTPLWHYIEVADFFVSDNNIVWVDNNDNTSYTFTGQSEGSKTYYVHAIDTLGNSTDTVSVNVNINFSSGNSGSSGKSYTPNNSNDENDDEIIDDERSEDIEDNEQNSNNSNSDSGSNSNNDVNNDSSEDPVDVPVDYSGLIVSVGSVIVLAGGAIWYFYFYKP
jgi:hypothetical protein